MNLRDSEKEINNLFVYALASLSIFWYYLSIFAASVNIPCWDDYDAILGFANNFLSNTHNKLALLFSLHNEHRILLCRASTVLLHFLSGKINFRILTMIGNFSLLALAAGLLSSAVFPLKKTRPIYLLPVILILFQPQYWESSLVSTSSLSCLPVIFFAFLTLHYLGAGRIKNFLFALVTAIAATFINGNGMLIFLSGLIILFFYKRPKESMTWIFAGIVTACVYFIGYARPIHHPDPLGIFNYPIMAISYFFTFIGSAIPYFFPKGFEDSKLLPLSGGVLFFVYFIFLSCKIKSGKVNIAIFAFLAYLFITAFVVTLFRSGFGVDQALSSRYALYSALFIIFVYITLVGLLPVRTFRSIFPFLLMLSIFFNYHSYKDNLQIMSGHKKMLIYGLDNWRINNNSGLRYPDRSRANDIMQEAIKNGLYEPQP